MSFRLLLSLREEKTYSFGFVPAMIRIRWIEHIRIQRDFARNGEWRIFSGRVEIFTFGGPKYSPQARRNSDKF
jgi:hypothetical protein